MTKKEYLKELDKLNLDKNKYCIIAGGVMLLNDLRSETNDIDLRVKPDYFKELSNKYKMTKSPKYSYLYNLNDFIEIAVTDFNESDITFINGYPVLKLEKELEWKLKNNRPKDQSDIEKIKKYLKIN